MEIDQEAPRLTPEELRKTGELLYGTQWQTDLARALEIDSRRVRDWLQERRPIPLGIRFELIKLLKERSKNIDEHTNYLVHSNS